MPFNKTETQNNLKRPRQADEEHIRAYVFFFVFLLLHPNKGFVGAFYCIENCGQTVTKCLLVAVAYIQK